MTTGAAVLACRTIRKTVGNGSRNYFVELAHRAKAAVLMRALRVSAA
jgi:pantothenate synthetase